MLFRSFFLFFLFLFIYLSIHLFIYGCFGSSSPCEGSLQLRRAGATLHRSARASHYRSLSRCGAQAPDAQAQQLWLTGPAAPRHVGSSQTRARTRVPCIGRQTPNHCATREAPVPLHLYKILCAFICMKDYETIVTYLNMIESQVNLPFILVIFNVICFTKNIYYL